MQASIRDIELAFAAEAASHACAAAELNPFGEAEVLEIGEARAVYCGQWSPVHGVFGLGLDGPVEERDVREADRFFLRKERAPAYWICPLTDSSLVELLGRDFAPTKKISVFGAALDSEHSLPKPHGDSRPDHQAWAVTFTQLLDPQAREAGLLALTKLHQKDTRFYLGTPSAASYTYFHRGLALVPYPSAHSLLALQMREAKEFRTPFLASAGTASPLPLLYERTLYERL